MTSRTTQHNHAATLQDGLTLGDLVRAFGTKAQADAFQAAVPELLQDSGFKPMRWDRDGEGHGALFPTKDVHTLENAVVFRPRMYTLSRMPLCFTRFSPVEALACV